MAALGSLVVSLSANTAEFTAGMDKAAYQTDKAMKQMKKDAEAVGVALKAMAGVGVGALALMVKSSLDAMDTMSKLAQQTGTAVESLSALSYTAGMSGVSQEKLGGAMVKLVKNMSDVASGTGEAKKGFDALRLSVTNSDGTLKSSDAMLSELAGKFASFKDGAEKTALAVNIFGDAGAAMIPMLNSGADGLQDMADEAKKMGLVMDTEAARAAEVFNDTMSKLTQQQTAFANAITTAVLPVLQVIADKMLGASNNTDKFSVAGEGVKVVLQTLTVLAAEVAFVFARVGNTIGGTAAQLSRLAQLDFKGVGSINDMIKADDVQARKDHDAFLASILNPSLAKAAAAPGVTPVKTTAPRMAAAAAPKNPHDDPAKKLMEGQIKAQEAFIAAEKTQLATRGQYLQYFYQQEYSDASTYYATKQTLIQDALNAELAAYDKETAAIAVYIAQSDKLGAQQDGRNKLAEVAQKRHAAETAASKQLTDAVLEQAKVYRDFDLVTTSIARTHALANAQAQFEIDLMGRSTLEVALLCEQKRIQLALEERLYQMRNQNLPQAEMQRAIVESETQKNAALALIEQGYHRQREGVMGASRAVQKYTEEAGNQAAQIENMMTNAFQGAEGALANFVKSGKLDFKSLADSMISDMVRIAVQQSITKPLAQMAGTFLSGMFAEGGAFDGGRIQPFAKGGAFSNTVVSSPTLFKFAQGTGMMGEAGPEAIMPLARGADGSLGVRASGGGGGSSVVVNVIESPGNGGQQSRRTENGVDMLDIMVEKIKSSIAGDISQGSGAVPAAMSRTYGLNRTVGAY